MKVKFDNEVRLSLGVAMVKLIDGTVVGLRAKPFVYSSKILLSIKDHNLRRKTEMDRVKNLQGNNSHWIVGIRNGSIYENDDLIMLKDLGGVKQKKLFEMGILNVGEMKTISCDEIDNLCKIKGFTKNQIMLWKQQASNCLPGSAPANIDHRKELNPYLSKYGEEEWETKIDASRFLSNFVCITKLIEHMVFECNKLFQGTIHKNDWVFYHDALSLFTAKILYNG